VARAAKYQREVRVYMDPPAPEKDKETDQDSGRFFTTLQRWAALLENKYKTKEPIKMFNIFCR